MTSEKLSQAIQFIKAGKKEAALPILKDVVQVEPNNESAWLWLYSCVEKIEQKKYCLHQALKINPNNQDARIALSKLENQMSSNSQSANIKASVSTQRKNSESATTQYKSNKTSAKNNVLPVLIVIGLLICLFLLIILVIIVKPPIISQVFTLSPESTYSSSMKPVLDEIQTWINGPVKQYEVALLSPYGHGNSDDYTNLDAINYYDLMPEMMRLSGKSSSQIAETQKTTRVELNENLFPTLNAIKQDGFVIVTKLEGISPPDSIKAAHERVSSCINYKIEVANFMLVFLDTGDDSNIPAGDCNFFEESLQMVLDFTK